MSRGKPKIKLNETAIEKYNTYRNIIEKYNKAIENGFYFEAIFIGYALIDDRLKSFIYHLNLIDVYRGRKSNNLQLDNELKIILKYDKDSINIRNISTKIFIIKKILAHLKNNEKRYSYEDMFKQLDNLNINEVLKKLKEIQNWSEYRNELVHALMNKDNETLNKIVIEKAKLVESYFRYIDKQVTILKKA